MDTVVIVALVAAAASLLVALITLGTTSSVRKRVLLVEENAKRMETVRTKIMTSTEEMISAVDSLKHTLANVDFLIEHQGGAPKEAIFEVAKAKGEISKRIPQIRLYWSPELIQGVEETLEMTRNIPMERGRLSQMIKFLDQLQLRIAQEFKAKYVDTLTA
jgi:hypothetical protein